MTSQDDMAGVVEMAGDGTSMSPGDRVAVYNKLFCGWCEQFNPPLTCRHVSRLALLMSNGFVITRLP